MKEHGKGFIDMSGQKFNHLTVLEQFPFNTNDKKSIWIVQCDCDSKTIFTTTGKNLRTGNTKSCGCAQVASVVKRNTTYDTIQEGEEMKKKRKKIKPGQRFTRLVTVKQVDELDPYGKKKWLCKCDCGNTIVTSAAYLRNGHKKSCGCLQQESRHNISVDLTGRRFERLTVLGRDMNDWTQVKWICRCDCGNIVKVLRENLLSGNTKSCGCYNRDLARARAKDITGQRFGKLVAIKKYHGEDTRKYKTTRWLCKCDCGNETVVSLTNLANGHTRSCGCLAKEIQPSGGGVTTHGITTMPYGKKIQGVHSSMISRCYKEHRDDYKRYGGRGIKICKEWYTPGVHGNPGLVAFYHWAMDNGYAPGLSIDRIDNDGPYAPWNCRWITMQEQCYNKSTNRHIVDADGERLTFAEFEKKHGLKQNYVSHAVRHRSVHAVVYEVTHPELKLKFKRDDTCIDEEGFMHLIPRYDTMYDKEVD